MDKKGQVSHRLLKGLTDEERVAYEAAYKRARKVLERINKYATDQSQKTAIQQDNPENFASPNWQHLVAWYGGYRTAMRIVQDLTRT